MLKSGDDKRLSGVKFTPFGSTSVLHQTEEQTLVILLVLSHPLMSPARILSSHAFFAPPWPLLFRR
jgi:hypothetical protein